METAASGAAPVAGDPAPGTAVGDAADRTSGPAADRPGGPVVATVPPGGRNTAPHVSAAHGHPRAAAALLATALTLAVAAVVLLAIVRPPWNPGQWFFIVDVADAVVYGVVAWLVLRRTSHPAAWLLGVTAVGGGLAAVGSQWSYLVVDHPGWPQLGPVSLLQNTAWVPGTLALFTIIPWLVRRGPLGPLGRLAVVAGALAAASLLAARLTDPFPWPDAGPWSPLAVRSTWWPTITADALRWQILVVVVLGLLATADVVRRWYGRPLDERRGLGWLAIGTGLMAVSFVPLTLPDSVAQQLPVYATPLTHLASQAFFPAAVLVAVLGQRLWGLDLAVSRTLVWGLLTGGLVGAYVAVVELLAAVMPGRDGASLVATALVAVAFQPARVWVQRRVDRLVHGDASEPLQVVRRLGAHLGEAGGNRELLTGITESVAASLKLGSATLVAIADDQPLELATTGEPRGEAFVVPLTYQQREVGQLVVTARPGERLDGRTEGSLAELAPVVAATVHLAMTSRALRQSQARIAAARDEERRTLRRELHDGLGPALAGIGLGLQASRNLLAANQQAAAELLDRMVVELDQRVEEVRGLARGLLPPALGELGLQPALEQLRERYAVGGLAIELAVDDLPPLSPELAGAVFGIVSEAVRNVHRHAGTDRCTVRLAAAGTEGELLVEIGDTGAGIAHGAAAGVGLQSMRERAEGVGGRLTVSGLHPHGTLVSARIPLPAEVVAR